ncbi:hypothetical protein D3C71_1485430 [compost metagenome]
MPAGCLPAILGGFEQLITLGIDANTLRQPFQHRLLPRVLHQLEEEAGLLAGHSLRIACEREPGHTHHNAQQQHHQKQLQQGEASRAALFHSDQLPISASISSPPG